MAIKVKGNIGGDVTGRNKTDGSEVEINKDDTVQEIDIGGDVSGDVTGLDKATNSKKKSRIVFIIIAIGTILTTLAMYYFNQN